MIADFLDLESAPLSTRFEPNRAKVEIKAMNRIEKRHQ